MKREYPFGRVRQDSVAQPFRSETLARLCAEILERMTGDECDVVPRGQVYYYVVRLNGDRWIRA